MRNAFRCFRGPVMESVLRFYYRTRSLLRPLRAAWRLAHALLLLKLVDRRWRRRRPQARHALPAPLIVSLTSYPPRFHSLASSLKCLLMQSVQADLVVLWLAPDDRNLLPANVLALQGAGLCIETCADTGPFKKLVPARERWRNAFIATADDDVFYPHTWLAELIAGWAPERREIPCHRAHAMTLSGDRTPAPYAHWRFEARAGEASPIVFPTGVGGVLYPPGCLHAEATEPALFESLCPTGDDVWFYWMARRQGWVFRRVGQRRFVCWPRTQDVALKHENIAHRNDLQISRLVARFGFAPHAAIDAPVLARRTLRPAW